MIGPPGSGKSMIAKRVPGIMPRPSLDEYLDILRIHSAAGQTLTGVDHFLERPSRAPHHTISDVGLLGGGAISGPGGDLARAHNGVLFLDELPEFKRSALEVLRQPLEDGHVTISRSAGKITLPCNFMLVAAMNPCPCGYLGDPKRECRCSPAQVQRYRARLSGPLLDRIDLHIEASPPLSLRRILLVKARPRLLHEVMRNRVDAARLPPARAFHRHANGRQRPHDQGADPPALPARCVARRPAATGHGTAASLGSRLRPDPEGLAHHRRSWRRRKHHGTASAPGSHPVPQPRPKCLLLTQNHRAFCGTIQLDDSGEEPLARATGWASNRQRRRFVL